MPIDNLPPKLAEIVEQFALASDRTERVELLIEMADRFQEVPERIARRPFPEERRVPHCESEAYVWADPQPDGAMNYHFAVENPQGLSAKALAVILQEGLSGLKPEDVLAISPDLVFDIFGRDLSMGKGLGLTGMISTARDLARRQLAEATAAR